MRKDETRQKLAAKHAKQKLELAERLAAKDALCPFGKSGIRNAKRHLAFVERGDS